MSSSPSSKIRQHEDDEQNCVDNRFIAPVKGCKRLESSKVLFPKNLKNFWDPRQDQVSPESGPGVLRRNKDAAEKLSLNLASIKYTVAA